MNSIKIKILLLFKAILIGLLVILFLVFDKNIERLVIVFLTYLISSILRDEKINIYFLNSLILGCVVGIIIGSIGLYIHVNNYKDKYNKYYEAGDKKIDKPAIVLVAKGESKNFDPISISYKLYKEDDYFKKALTPYNVFLHKMAYEEMGTSDYNDLCNSISDLLQENLGYDYDVFLTYTNTHPKPTEELEEFIKVYDKIILTPLFLYETTDYKFIKDRLVKKLLYTQTKLEITPLLWNSEKLAKQIALKASNLVDSNDKSLTGILLIQDNTYSIVKQKKQFLNNIVNYLNKYEFDINKVLIVEEKSLGNSIKNNVHRLQEMGIGRVIIINTSDITDDIKDKREVVRIIDKIVRTEHINIKYISGWGIGEELLNELEYQTRIIHLTD